MRVIVPAIIDQAGRKYNVDEADGVSRRHRRLYEGASLVMTVKLVRESGGRLRFLEPAEEAALRGAAEDPLRTLILVGIHAGLLVRSEALTRRWADVDLRPRPDAPHGLLTVQGGLREDGADPDGSA